MIKADLHTHSYYSDGRLSPTEMVKQAKKAGIRIIALTDHTSIKGVGEAMIAGKKLGIRVIPASEITGREGEILAYFINPKDKSLVRLLKHCAQGPERNVKHLITFLRKYDKRVSFHDLAKVLPHAKHNFNRGHFVTYLWLKRVNPGEDFWKKSNFRKRKYPALEVPLLTIVRFVKKQGGVSVLAHPWLSKELFFNQKKMKKLIVAGLAGIEFDNGDRSLWDRDARTVKKIKYYAKKYNLILTKGTDYHALPWMKGIGHKPGKTFCSEKIVEQLEKVRFN